MEISGKKFEKRTKFDITRRWVSPVPRKRPRWAFVREIFGKNLRNYCESSSLVGYRYLVEPKRSWIERAIWIVLHATTLCMLGLLVHGAYKEYQDVPVVTVVDSDNYPSHKLEFPGIAICNINRISRRAAVELAKQIVSANVTNQNFTDVLHLLHQFGALYISSAIRNGTDDNYLDQLLLKYFKGDYDVTSIMKNLSPTCTDGLSSCHFQGEARNCSDIFAFRKTQDGYCCTFNYARESDDIPTTDGTITDVPRQPYFINSLGLTNGLSLVMEPFAEDYYYPMLPITGWKVTVFNAHDYPDNGSGSVSEALLSPATETFVELDDEPVLYSGYTYSDCLVDCRATAIWETCKCRPFFLPRRGNEQYSRKVCNTGHSECLYRNRDIYWTVLSSKVDEANGESSYARRIKEISQCDKCFPACNDVRYYLYSSTTYLNRGIYHTELLNNVRLENQSIVHIYFTRHGSVRLKQEAAYYWYELLSNVGGICGVFIGFSLISVAEFLYFTLCILHEFCRGSRRETIEANIGTGGRTIRTRTGTKWGERGNAKRFAGTLYWNEFLTHSSVTSHDGKMHRLQVRRS